MIRKMTSAVLFLQLMMLPLSAQTVLTYANNAMKDGDSVELKVLKESVSAGASGASQVWDFSGAEFEGTSAIDYDADFSATPGNGAAFACTHEGGRITYYDITSTGKFYKEVSTPGGNIVFDEPVKELAFPFRYGDGIRGKLQGTNTTLAGIQERIDGNYTVVADAYGTLILPNGVTLKNVLRVKYEKIYQQMHGGALYNISVLHYLFYAAESRYPVLQINENQTACDCGCAYNSAATFFDDSVRPNSNLSKPGTGDLIADETITYRVHPNPFVDVLNFDYSLSKDLKLQVSLFDMQGKRVAMLIDAQKQGGSYTFSENLQHLPAATYVLRIMADDLVISEKVIKKEK